MSDVVGRDLNTPKMKMLVSADIANWNTRPGPIEISAIGFCWGNLWFPGHVISRDAVNEGKLKNNDDWALGGCMGENNAQTVSPCTAWKQHLGS